MEQSTAKIISQIAEIQLEALHKLKENKAEINQEALMKLLETKEDEIDTAIDNHINLYEDLKDNPDLIKMLNEYQTSLCSYILWRMEDSWVSQNQEGVLGAWSIIIAAQRKFHPEYQIIL